MSTHSVSADADLDGRWQIDPRRSSVRFQARHFWGLMTVSGQFDGYDGRLDLSAAPAIELTIDAATIDTGHAKRDQHLRAGDFFDVEHHPQITFVSDSVKPDGDALGVRGRLSARGRSIPLTLDAHMRRVGGELQITAATTAPHRELGLTFNLLGMIRPHSKLIVDARAVRAPSDPLTA